MSKSPSWYASRYVERFGMHIVPLEPGMKFPRAKNWGENCLTTPEDASAFYEKNPTWGMGAALGPSRLCSIDIDNLPMFKTICECLGIDLEALIQENPTIKGRGYRVTFRVPDGAVLPYQKISWPSKNDPTGDKHRAAMRAASAAKDSGDTERESRIRAVAKRWASVCVFEMRSAEGQQRQDVLPPTIHPETNMPYEWVTQPRVEWPVPPKWLMALWQSFDSFKPQLMSMCPWLPEQDAPVDRKPRKPVDSSESPDVIRQYVDSTPIESALEQYGYKRVSKGRYLSPHSGTGLPGVIVFSESNSCWVHHASDPLCSDASGKPVNAFDLLCYYDHGADVKRAVDAVYGLLGIERRSRATPRGETSVATPPVAAAANPESEPDEPADEPARPFRFLGYNGKSYYYLPRGTEQVAEITRSGHTSVAEMLSLASIEWWDLQFPKERGGVDWYGAASWCMRESERRGIYSHDRERGRGAWYDKGHAVLHLGDRLLVDGEQVRIADHDSKFIYTKQAPLEHGANAVPATDSVGEQILDAISDLKWSKPVHGVMMAGWCFLAPICGALPWRPHIWLTAQRGAGKTWTQDHIIYPLLGPAAMMVQGGTSEAGIRQRLKQDARPIVFDEAESEDQKSQSRMQSVIELARQASSDSTAEIVKGTVSGSGMSFRMRSMFMLGSVNVALSQAADESRFSVISLRTPEKTQAESDRFHEFAKHVDNLFTDETCASIRARAYSLMPVIRRNAKVFARAVAEVLGSQRIGDQVGTLIAGAFGLSSRDEVNIDQARRFVQSIDFSDAKESEAASDEESCLQRIMQAQIRFDVGERGTLQRAIGEVVGVASGKGEAVYGLTQADANDTLKRYGLAVDGRSLVVANQHAELTKLLTGTPWGAGWKRILSRIPGATTATAPVRFAGTRSRAVKIPLEFIE